MYVHFARVKIIPTVVCKKLEIAYSKLKKHNICRYAYMHVFTCIRILPTSLYRVYMYVSIFVLPLVNKLTRVTPPLVAVR